MKFVHSLVVEYIQCGDAVLDMTVKEVNGKFSDDEARGV